MNAAGITSTRNFQGKDLIFRVGGLLSQVLSARLLRVKRRPSLALALQLPV